MKLLSIDIGIKNLAFCLINVSATETVATHAKPAISECNILQWGVIDVCHSEQDEIAAVQRAAAHHKCSHTYKTKSAKMAATLTTTTTATTTCASNAAFFYYKDDHLHFICKRHANKMREYNNGGSGGGKCADKANIQQHESNAFHYISDAIEGFGPLKPAKLLNTGTAEQLFAFCNAHDACEPEWKAAAPRWHGLKPVMRERARRVMRTRYMHAYDALDEMSAILNPEQVVPATQDPVSTPSKSSLLTSNTKTDHVSLITVGHNLMVKFDKLFYNYDYSTPSETSPDKVIIENQISPIATRMKTVQGMVTQYFLMRGISPDRISYMSATNKLKAWTSVNNDADEIDTYDGRKKMGVACVRKLLSSQDSCDDAGDAGDIGGLGMGKRKKFKMSANTALQWRSVFESHKKKDDMADSLLQGLSYL